MKKIVPGAILIALALGGACFVSCDSFSTVREAKNANGAQQVVIKSERVSGLIYYLPRGKIRITGDFSPGSAAVDSKPGPSGNNATARSSGSTFAKTVLGDAGGAAADAASQKNFYITIAVDVEADPSARYYLKPGRNYFYDDEIHLKINAKHLLTTGTATAQDQTAQILSTTASLVTQIMGEPTSVKAFLALQTMTVGELLNRIVEKAADNNISLDTRIEVSREALENFEEALPTPFPEANKREIGVRLGQLKAKDKTWFTPREIRDLLKLFDREQAVQIAKRPVEELFKKLFSVLEAAKLVQPRPFSVVFDPEDKQDFSAVANCGFILDVRPEVYHEISLLKKAWSSSDARRSRGIVFRAVRPYRLEIKSVPNTWFYIHENRIVLLPDTEPDHALVLDYSRMPFVKKTTNITFVDGIPQELGQTVPSPVMGFLAIPKGIIQAIAPLPTKATGGPSGMQTPGTSGTSAAPSASPSSGGP